MAPSGTSISADPEDYQANFRGERINLVFTGPGTFKARLTWLELSQLHLLRAEENLPRIAHTSLPPTRVYISFPANSHSHPMWGGIELRFGTIVFHELGGHSHERTSGPNSLGFISVAPEHLAASSNAIIERKLVPPTTGRVLRPSRSATVHLLRLFAKACHLAEHKPEIIAHPEVARAVEQELLRLLINCLPADAALENLSTRRQHARIMAKFEDALTGYIESQVTVSQLAAAVGVPEHTLMRCCAQTLGMNPSRYLRLRRLNLVRSELRRADPATASIKEIAQRFQFFEPKRFAGAYRRLFGELPSTTLGALPSRMRDEKPLKLHSA
jgi:AraC-like DNA-binding protein